MGNREPSVLDKIKHPILVGILCLLLGFGGAFIFPILDISPTSSFVAEYISSLIPVLSVFGVFLILRRIFRSSLR
jgi:hypothetical protein